MELDQQTDLSLTRRLAATPAALWACWTTPDLLRRFFLPPPHTVTECDIDLRVGGAFNTTFLVDGQEITNRGVFLEIIEHRKLVFTDGYGAGWKPAPDPFMTAIISFEEDPDGGTRYTAIARHRSRDARRRHEDMGFYAGWGTVTEQLETCAKALS